MSVEVRPTAPRSAGARTESVARPPPAGTPQEAGAVSSDQLFNGATELLIDHRGVLYRLRHTALGKLILTK